MLSLKKLASTHLAKSLWNAPFKSEELSNIIEDIENKWEVRLANHREKTINASNAFIEKNKLPLIFKSVLKECIFSLYHAYRQMILWKITYDPDDNIDLLKEDGLYAPNYFADGEFHDFIFAKQLVMNSTYRINHRFYLACFYWFENETSTIWSELKRADCAPFTGDLDDILPQVEPLVALRILELEDLVQVLEINRQYGRDFWEAGFLFSARKGYEHATYYFWQNISESIKISIIKCDSIFKLMSEAIDYPDDKVSYFLYSQLPKARKENLLHWTIKKNKPQKWLTLLLSPYTRVIFSEIIEFVYRLPIKLYSNLLQFLALRIQLLKIPSDNEIFQVLWRKLSSREIRYTLEEGYIMQRLVKGKSFYNIGYIIKGLSLEQKEKCLFNESYMAGINILDILSKEGEFDLLQNYLSFFLIEIDPLTRRETLRKDASLFLQKFIETPEFRTWCKNEITQAEERKVNERIDILQTSLALLDELCEKVCKEVIHQQASTSLSFFKADQKVNEEIDLTFSSPSCKCEEDNPAKRIRI